MKHLKLFENFLTKTNLHSLLPTKEDLIELIDDELLNFKFRQSCQAHAYPQLIADKLLSKEFDLSDKGTDTIKIAIISNLESRYSFDKTKQGLEELSRRLGREADIENIMDDLIEMESQEEIDSTTRHIISSSLILDILLIEDVIDEKSSLLIRVEGKFVVKYDDFAAFTCPIEKQDISGEPSKEDIINLIKEVLSEISTLTIGELDELKEN